MTPSNPEPMYLISDEELERILVGRDIVTMRVVRARGPVAQPAPDHHLIVCGKPAIIEDCPWCDGSGKRMRPTGFNPLRTHDAAIATQAREEGARVEREREDACFNCKTGRRLGCLPCPWRADLDIAAMKKGSPEFIITACTHQKSFQSKKENP